jgi:hypothetical protein
MRRPTFGRWIRRLILDLANTDSFNIRKLTAAAQKDKPRLTAPLFFYAYDHGTIDKLLELIWKDDLRRTYKEVLTLLHGAELTTIALKKRDAANLPAEYLKILNSYRAAYNKNETTKASKKMRWEKSHALQLEKGVNTAEIYHALGLNAGNVNDYLKHGSLDKVSLENATSIMKFLYEY